MADGFDADLDTPPEDRVQTAHGTICLVLMSEDAARVSCGKDVGWFRQGGATLYATVMMRRAAGTWVIDPVHSAVTDVVDGKAGERVPADARDAAWAVLRDTFAARLADRPDLVARVALAGRRREERAVEGRIRDLQGEVARLRAGLPALREAREEAEAGVARALAAMAPAPTP